MSLNELSEIGFHLLANYIDKISDLYIFQKVYSQLVRKFVQ